MEDCRAPRTSRSTHEPRGTRANQVVGGVEEAKRPKRKREAEVVKYVTPTGRRPPLKSGSEEQKKRRLETNRLAAKRSYYKRQQAVTAMKDEIHQLKTLVQKYEAAMVSAGWDPSRIARGETQAVVDTADFSWQVPLESGADRFDDSSPFSLSADDPAGGPDLLSGQELQGLADIGDASVAEGGGDTHADEYPRISEDIG